MRESLKERSKGRCEVKISHECTGKAEHEHHRMLRSQGGTDAVENILCTCVFCHRFIHDNPAVASLLGWIVESWEDYTEKKWYPFNWYVNLPSKSLTREEGTDKVIIEEKRKRVVWSMKVPKDERENGYEIFDSLLGQARERIAPILGYSETCPPYYILVAVLVDFLRREGK